MEIFKDAGVHAQWSVELKAVYECLNTVNSRMVEKQLDTVIENISHEMMFNLTVEAATAVEALMERHPDTDIDSAIHFLVFKDNVKVESAKEFILRTGVDAIDENTTAQVRVYERDFFIEVLEDGRHYLCIENSDWIEPDTSLEAMELELFNYSQVA